ncbi:MAG: CPBP family intramembrane metalloprotease [Bacteroidia bacterium]|nr:CPBP family intramembrane metalloprotease [Bacteroidia bacterium]
MINKSPSVIAVAMLVVIGLIMLMPTVVMFNKVLKNDFKAEYVDLTFKMGLLFLMGYSFIRKLNIDRVAGLSRQYPWRFKYLNFIPVYLFIIGFLGVYSRDFGLIEPTNLILLLIACLMVGFAEEYLFRGVLQSIFLKKYAKRKNGILMSVLLTSLFFGFFHLINLANNDNTWQVLVQVVFAMFIGFFFGVLLLKTNKLIPIAITHGLINFFFSLALLPGIKTIQDEATNAVSFAPIIVFLPLLIIGLFIYKKLDKKEIIQKLKTENIRNLESD